MKPTFVPSGPERGTAFFTLGLTSCPWLADHRLQDMIVLPGAFYLEAAVVVQQEILGKSVGSIRRAEFHRPVIVSARDLTLAADVRWDEPGTVRYAFFESGASGAARPCATLEVEPVEGGGAAGPVPPTPVLDSVDPGAPAGASVLTGEQFYARLIKKGNQYGAQFQSLAGLSHCGREVQAELTQDPSFRLGSGHRRRVVLLDAAVQLPAVFQLERGGTFVLRGIDQVVLGAADWSEAKELRGRRRPSSAPDRNEQWGDVTLRDRSGRTLIECRGVRSSNLAESAAPPSALPAPTPVRVAANFTAEPMEEALQFWGDYLPWPFQIRFTPYNQIFQELLTPGSAFRENAGGFNVMLVNLAEWSGPVAPSSLQADPALRAGAWGQLPRYELRPGFEVAHLNRHETEYVYREIFEDRCYLRHGIRLPERATVVDVGANIGLFSLFVRSQAPHARVLAFEPSPLAFRALEANCAAYGPGLQPFNCGVGEKRGTAPFTVYEKSSVFSSFHANRRDDGRAIEAVVTNLVRAELGPAGGPVGDYVRELTTDRLEGQTLDCPLLSISDIIRDNGLERIDLLKIDAEKSELEILRGIAADAWPRIDQLVIEVHDPSGRTRAEILRLLENKGFHCAVDEETRLAGSGLSHVYATRGEPTAEPRPASAAEATAESFLQALEAFPAPPRSTTVLCFCPGERKGLPGAGEGELERLEQKAGERARRLPHVRLLSSAAILAQYPTDGWFDRDAHELGHIPYSAEGGAAIATALVRALAEERKPLAKVLALDCDHTLWRGICGEDGPLGIIVTPGHRALQEFVLGRMEAGMLLCLCSKNSPEDVWAVFEQNPGMVLQRRHLAGAWIDWAPKSTGLRSLARELKLGLDSFVLLDDSPQECAEIQAHCPTATAITLPRAEGQLRPFLEHLWILDGAARTAADGHRTRSVQEGRAREQFRAQTSTLKDFIAGLQLQVVRVDLDADRRARAAQLTQRTNQFNFTAVRRTESDLSRFLQDEEGRGFAVDVSDRFGAYGLVGLVLFQAIGQRYRVDTFLLSCRALGRGVEHQMLARLGEQAVAEGKERIELRWVRTGKNQPAWNFLRSVGSGVMREGPEGAVLEFSAAELASLRYDPEQAADLVHPPETFPASSGNERPPWADKFETIARDLSNVKQITAAMAAKRGRPALAPTAASGAAEAGTLTSRLLRVWRSVLGRPGLGPDDNFSDAGGSSLQAVQIVAAIRRELALPATVVMLFECPTVQLLAEKLGAKASAEDRGNEAKQRGARRLPPRWDKATRNQP